ncbi:hypothetical protein ZIOFF_061388 [Zingiber officinale]|uniref:BHLH domain-containing protein n=1 Tax=Zingiber officinale TaxID=94328 RepID=A0A8J5K9S0_ZINOF|nr:hypothetical protein ZIOFF_061388 [Zingiber officinale]
MATAILLTHSLTHSPQLASYAKHRLAHSDDSKVEQQNLCLWLCSYIVASRFCTSTFASFLWISMPACGTASASNKARTHKSQALLFKFSGGGGGEKKGRRTVGDQASIVAGAINYVKELEQLLQSLEVQKRLKQRADAAGIASAFDDFFSFPQYCAYSPAAGDAAGGEADEAGHQTGTANIEVTMVESHANLKVLSRRRPRQLFELVVGLQTLRLLPLHLNVTSVHHMAMYSFSLKVCLPQLTDFIRLNFFHGICADPFLPLPVKVEDDCPYTSVDEIATAVHQMLGKIQEAANF